MPYLVLNKPIYTAGEKIVIHYVNPAGVEDSWVGIYSPPSDVANSRGDGMQYRYMAGGEDASKHGTIIFNAMPAGTYQARLHYADDYPIAARIEFTVE